MKSIILIFFLVPFNLLAQKIINSKSGFLTLTVVRNNYSYTYKPASPLKIIYIKNGIKSSIKGRLIRATSDGIYILSFHKDTTPTPIAVDSIFSVKKLFRKTRMVTGIIMGATVVGGIAL